ncbi:MAG: pilus assembly protein [Proteobacteria bacterium]|nr:pilus assembly protein [Pseudomonadota bacterium]
MLRHIREGLATFCRDRGGNVAVIFGFSVIPVMGLAGGVVDLHQATRDMAGLQSAFDAASIAGVRQAALGSAVVTLAAQNHLDGNLSARLKTYPISVAVSDGGKTVRISTNGTMETTFLGVLGMKTMNIVAKSTATSTTIQTITQKKPVVAQLDPNAGDYNRMYVYCYDDARRNEPSQGRSQMTAIADNAGTTYNFNMPACKPNETFSYRLYNVRNARTQPALWDTAQPGTLIANNAADWADPWSNNRSYNYYSDTRLVGGVPTHQFAGGVPILETVICDNLGQCKNKGQGGVIPTGTNRTPQQATKACSPGKYIYFGWEDRPPGYGWTDSDYDDIRVIVECPSSTTTSTTVVRLVE